MVFEDDRLLMEALLLFSSEDSDDTGTDSQPEPLFGHSGELGGGGESMVALLQAIPDQRPENERQKNLPAPKPRRRMRSRNSKCTYVARREEAARLRALTAQLEDHLRVLQEHQFRRQDLARQTALREHDQLTQSQAENARLRSLMAENEARIHETAHVRQDR